MLSFTEFLIEINGNNPLKKSIDSIRKTMLKKRIFPLNKIKKSISGNIKKKVISPTL